MRFVRSRSRPSPRARLLLAASACAALAGLAGGFWWLAHAGYVARTESAVGASFAAAGRTLGFAVQNVAVDGRERESRQAILDAVGVKRGVSILSIDLDAAKARLEALPWVRAADVERLLPDTLFVHLTERRPLAFWQRHGKLALLADDGHVMANARLEDYGALVVLVGDDAPKVGASLLDALATEPALFPHVAAAVRVGARRWNIRLDSGIDVALPESDAEGAWHRLAALDRSESLLARNIVAVDLRLPDRLVLRLPPEPPKSPATKKAKPAGNPT
ncbi:MAG TPA: FtsQ-type POTRA domain-containing protein [Stellaceae bacterium]|nr:FtsQ-type POTRA domain-containing protein [Stellaceae bacterium]